MAVADHVELSYSLVEEIELLEAIYIHELSVQGPHESPTAVSVLLHPSTGDDEHKRFVCLTLVIHLPQKYPSELPSINIKTPRGLSEAHIKSILSNLRELAESCLGRPMLYELIEYAKESLTDNNVPSCTCAICLCHFQDSGEFTKTECYHYFHCGCLARYIEYSLQQEDEKEDKTKVECPMCRLPITYNLTQLQSVASSKLNEEKIVYKPSEEIRILQKQMASLFEKQKKKGGIIDIERERSRYLIDITSVRQEETLPESDPNLGTDTDALKTDPVVEPCTNNAPRRQDGTKENNAAGKHIRSQKPERREKKEFPKDWRPSRGPRRPFDRAGNKSEEKFRQDKETTEKKRPAVDSRPRKTEEKETVKNSEKQGRYADGKQVDPKAEVEPDRKSSFVDVSEKVAGLQDISSKKDGNSSSQNSSGGRARSAKRRRGRSGRERTFGEGKSDAQKGGRDLNKNTTSLVDGKRHTAKTQSSRNVKSNLKTNPCSKGDAAKNSKQGTCVSIDMSGKPPPGFETVMVDKREHEQFRNDSRRPPPGFETHTIRPRPPRGLSSPVEGRTAQSTSQSVTS